MKNKKIKEQLKITVTKNFLLSKLYVIYKQHKLIKENDEQLSHAIKKYIGPEKIIDKKYLKHLKAKMIQCRYLEDFSYEDFFCFKLENKSFKERHQYIGVYEARRIFHSCRQSNRDVLNITKNKYLCYEALKKYYGREVIRVTSSKDFDKYLSFCQRHTKYIVKPLTGSLGMGIFSVDLENSAKALEAHFQDILNTGDCVVEEYIIQSDSMAKYHSSSVNTIRILVYKSPEKINLLYGLLHIGMGGNVASNGSAGGVTALVDLKSGRVYTKAFIDEGIVAYYDNHPENGTPILNAQIPRWNELIDLVYEISNLDMIDNIRIIGWDFALTDKGWVVIEGNNCPGIKTAQVFEGSGLRPVFKRANLI